MSTFVNGIADDFLRYYQTPYALKSASLSAERREWLRTPQALTQEPLIEVIPRYASDERALTTLTSRRFSEFVGCGLFDPEYPYLHQARALEISKDGGHFVVTAGTGSGKTECFLLPVVRRLLDEADRDNWAGTPAPRPQQWWRGGNYVLAPE